MHDRIAGDRRPIAIMAAWVFSSSIAVLACADEQSAEGNVSRKSMIADLMEQLRTDPERGPDEKISGWYERISERVVSIADQIVAHPEATASEKHEAIDRKLNALSFLARRDPNQYRQPWDQYSKRIVTQFSGQPPGRTAMRLLVQARIAEDPSDHEIVAEIECFVEAYSTPAAPREALGLYASLTQKLYETDSRRAIAILEKAIASGPAEFRATLQRHKHKLTMVGSTLTMTWPKLDGVPFSLEEFHGKVVFLYSWATWCAPCVAKFPELEELHSKYHKQGFEIVAVSQDDGPTVVIDFLSRHQYPWINVMWSREYQERYDRMGTPGGILIDRDGKVVCRGLVDVREIDAALEPLLGKKNHANE